ncbi:hypothetical protein O3P69_004132 [Scylla paramamosain]|uniref:Uncharacterized protein n=1 Tax=Scylla paramamosain TaxID=85552 RepID=A0AAW0UGQ3_SCYPA
MRLREHSEKTLLTVPYPGKADNSAWHWTRPRLVVMVVKIFMDLVGGGGGRLVVAVVATQRQGAARGGVPSVAMATNTRLSHQPQQLHAAPNLPYTCLPSIHLLLL